MPRFAFMRELLLAPDMASIKIEDHYRNTVRDSHKDKYRTAPVQHPDPSCMIIK